MAAQPLTAEQQTALDKFVTDAQGAAEAHDAKVSADGRLATLQDEVSRNTAWDVDAHVQALGSAQKFIDLMIPPSSSGAPPATAIAGKK